MQLILIKRLVAGAGVAALACSAFAATNLPRASDTGVNPIDASTGAQYTPSAPSARPIQNWATPQYFDLPTGVTASPSMNLSGATHQAKTTFDVSPFVPVTPCRLVDTRGAFSPVYGGPAFAAHEVRNYVIAGTCGIPPGTGHIRGVSLQVTTVPTVASGDIEVIRTGATLGGTVAMVIQAGQWNSVSIVSGVNSAGSIQVQLRSTPGHVVIDINGFFANLTTAQDDVLAVQGRHLGGGVLFVSNSELDGSAINAANGSNSQVQLAYGTNAVDIVSGDIRVRGAGLNTPTPAFIHTVNTATDLCPNPQFARLNNSDINLRANLLLFVTGTGGIGGGTSSFGPISGPASVYYDTSCNPAGGWTIYSPTGFTNGARFNILAIKP